MKIYKKEWEQMVPGTLEDVWNFFSRPENLDNITPKDMKFEILSDIEGKQMYEGMIIVYKVRPFLNIPSTWVTEITKIEDRKFFVDEQRVGPYKMWHHEHHFEEKDGGVLMRDILHYALPAEPFGSLLMGSFISRKVEGIFEYRKTVIPKYFPEKKSTAV